jgi:hypothetical protein
MAYHHRELGKTKTIRQIKSSVLLLIIIINPHDFVEDDDNQTQHADVASRDDPAMII